MAYRHRHSMLRRGTRSAATLIGLIGLLATYSCAHTGTPSGGPRDEEPPRYVRSSVAPGATNVKTRKIVIEFNEYINVKDAFSKVVVSPTASSVPRVTSQSRKVTVQFEDTLQPGTTYTIDFGNAIEDYNEGNALPNYAFWFSTGEEIDTLRISGMVLGARDLEPQQGMLVGVYRAETMADSTFRTVRLERVAKTDDRGRFTLRGLREGSYRLFALGDLNNDYKWDVTEDLAFLNVDLTPSAERVEVSDTLYDKKTMEIDTVKTRSRTRYLPNDVLLRSFNTGYKPQYLTKYEREDSTRLHLVFNTRQPALPELTLADGTPLKDSYVLEKSRYNDTLTYWLRDPELIRRDTLHVATRYLRTDTAQLLSLTNDTLRFVTKRAKAAKPKKKKKEETDSLTLPPPVPLGMRVTTSTSHEVYNPLVMEFDTPLHGLDTTAFRLLQQVDTLWKPVAKEWHIEPRDSLTKRAVKIEYPWEYGKKYKLEADSAAVQGIYGLYNKALTHEFTVKKEEEYCNLQFEITGLKSGERAFVELLNGSDTPTATAPVEGGIATFMHRPAGLAYARLVVDRNGNGEYDPGDYGTGLEPDVVYYYPKRIMLKANWDVVQTWDLFATSVDEQKPAVLKKNKPEADKKRRQTTQPEEEEEEDEFGTSFGNFS